MFSGIVRLVKVIGRRLNKRIGRRLKGSSNKPKRISSKKRSKSPLLEANSAQIKQLEAPPKWQATKALQNFSSVQLSPHTKRAYERDLRDFQFYLKKNNLDEEWQNLGASEIAAYRDHLIEKKFAKASITRKLAVLKSFYSWSIAQGMILRNPAETVRSFPQSQDSSTGFLTEEQVYLLLNYLERLDTQGRLSHHLAKVGISLLLMLGVRRSEACSLCFEDMQLMGDLWILKVKGKGGRDRQLPIAPLLLEHLEQWFRKRHPEECPAGSFERAQAGWVDFLKRRSHEPILISTQSKVFDKALSDGELARIVRKHCLKAGIPFRVSPHILRSTAITHALDQGATHRGVQQMAGWTSPLMISRYDKKRMDPKYSAIHHLRYAKKMASPTSSDILE
jgi:site-specific recombinase XerD